MEFKTYMLFTSNLEKAKEELEISKAQLIVDLTSCVFLVNVPVTINPSQLIHASPEKPSGMDLISDLMVEVWTRRKPKEMQNLLEKLLPENIPSVTKLENLELIK